MNHNEATELDSEEDRKETTIDNGWSNPPSIGDLHKDFTNSKSSFDADVAKISEHMDYLNITGIAKFHPKRNRSGVQPKTIRTQAEWRYPGLSEPFLSVRDLFTIEPKTWADTASAKQNEMLINYQFKTKIPLVKFIDEYVRVLVNQGTAIIRVGWDFQEGLIDTEENEYSFEPVEDEATIQQLGQAYQQVGQAMASSDKVALNLMDKELIIGYRMSMNTGQLTRAVVTGTKLVKKKGIINNAPTLEICDYKSVMVDPMAKGDISKAKFVIYEFDTSLSDLKAQTGKYSNLEELIEDAKKKADEEGLLSLDDDQFTERASFNYSDKARKSFKAYEYWGFWDFNNTGIAEPFVATWVGNTMIRLEENPFPDKKLPFEIVHYLPTDDNKGDPDGVLLRDNQTIISAFSRGIIDVMAKAAAGQRATRADALDIVNKRKFEQGLDFEFNGVGGDPSSLFHVFQFPEIGNSAPAMLQMQNSEAEALTGVKAFQTGSGGISGASLGASATAARGALDAASKREVAILRRLVEGMKNVARKIVAMNAVFLSEEEVIRVTDEKFITVKRDELKGEFNLDIAITTAEEDNAKAQELAFMLQTGAADADPEEVRMIRAEIAELRKMPELAKKIREFQPQPDPMVVEQQRLQIELLKAQIANENAKAHENNANGEYDMSRIQNEMQKAETEKAKQEQLRAQAAKLLAEADSIDLNYVEQESGVQQEREKEKIDLQHRATMMQKEKDVEIAKAKSTPKVKPMNGQ